MTGRQITSYDAISNRDRVRQPKRGKGYCFGCDAALVGSGEKCPVCGRRNGTKRNKK